MSNLFTRIDEAQAVIRRKGVFRQVPLYHRNGQIYAAAFGGFIRLMQHAGTTQPDTVWDCVYDPLKLISSPGTRAPFLLEYAKTIEGEK